MSRPERWIARNGIAAPRATANADPHPPRADQTNIPTQERLPVVARSAELSSRSSAGAKPSPGDGNTPSGAKTTALRSGASVEQAAALRFQPMAGRSRVRQHRVDPSLRPDHGRDAVGAPVASEQHQRPRLGAHRPHVCHCLVAALEQSDDAGVVLVVLGAEHRYVLEHPTSARCLEQERDGELGTVEVSAELVAWLVVHDVQGAERVVHSKQRLDPERRADEGRYVFRLVEPAKRRIGRDPVVRLAGLRGAQAEPMRRGAWQLGLSDAGEVDVVQHSGAKRVASASVRRADGCVNRSGSKERREHAGAISLQRLARPRQHRRRPIARPIVDRVPIDVDQVLDLGRAVHGQILPSTARQLREAVNVGEGLWLDGRMTWAHTGTAPTRMRLSKGTLLRTCMALGAAVTIGGGVVGPTLAVAAPTTKARVIPIDMGALRYSTKLITVKAGESVELRFRNTSTLTHEAFLGDDKAQIAHEKMAAAMNMGDADTSTMVTVKAGATKTLQTTFAKAGRTTIGCHQPGHYGSGMKLTVIVQPRTALG